MQPINLYLKSPCEGPNSALPFSNSSAHSSEKRKKRVTETETENVEYKPKHINKELKNLKSISRQ